MQTKYPYYVAPVRSNDDYSDEPTHCALEVRPSVVLMIAWYLALARLFIRLADQCSEVRFYFQNINWMTLNEDGNLLDEQIIEESHRRSLEEIRGRQRRRELAIDLGKKARQIPMPRRPLSSRA